MEQTEIIKDKTTKYKPNEPRKYHVIMHNDDETTMEFVVEVLITVFRKTNEEAEKTMLKIHHEGSAIVGTYHRDIAESKAEKVMKMARAQGFPLKLTTKAE